MTRVVLHIGLPKAASSSLQDDIFSQSDELYFVSHSLTPLFYDISMGDDAARERRISDLVDQIFGQEKTVILSDETFSMGPWLPNHLGIYEDQDTIVARLKKAFPAASVLFIVRRQAEWMQSWWRQYVTALGLMPYERILDSDFFEKNLRPALEYSRTVRRYQKAFGVNSVRVIPFALLQRDARTFVNQICSYTGMKKVDWALPKRNEGRSMLMSEIRRTANAAFTRMCDHLSVVGTRRDR